MVHKLEQKHVTKTWKSCGDIVLNGTFNKSRLLRVARLPVLTQQDVKLYTKLQAIENSLFNPVSLIVHILLSPHTLYCTLLLSSRCQRAPFSPYDRTKARLPRVFFHRHRACFLPHVGDSLWAPRMASWTTASL